MSLGRTLVIINPEARHGETAALVPVVEQLLSSIPHDSIMTEHTGHAADLAAAASSYDVVVAVGGDGTVHEVLNGLMTIPAGDRPTLGLLPTGSGNDTRRTLGIPTDLAEAATVLATGGRRRFDVGVCNGIYFNNSFAAGLDAKVTAKAVEYKVTTKRSGLWLYLTALLHVLFHDLGSFRCASPSTARTPSSTTRSSSRSPRVRPTAAASSSHPMRARRRALRCLHDRPALAPAGALAPSVVIAGKHTRMRPVHMSRHESLVIECDRQVPAQIDGEVLYESRYAISMLPSAIECIVPRDPR